MLHGGGGQTLGEGVRRPGERKKRRAPAYELHLVAGGQTDFQESSESARQSSCSRECEKSWRFPLEQKGWQAAQNRRTGSSSSFELAVRMSHRAGPKVLVREAFEMRDRRKITVRR
eukprot:765817-Hanusia_phi.AAC.2